MITVETTNKGKKHTVILYDDIDNLPIAVFSRFNKYLLIESNIGSTMADIDKRHLATLYKLAGEKDKTVQELNNLRQLLYLLLTETNTTTKAFACLVHKIDGEEMTDKSDTGLDDIVKQLSSFDLPYSAVKKNFQKSVLRYMTS